MSFYQDARVSLFRGPLVGFKASHALHSILVGSCLDPCPGSPPGLLLFPDVSQVAPTGYLFGGIWWVLGWRQSSSHLCALNQCWSIALPSTRHLEESFHLLN